MNDPRYRAGAPETLATLEQNDAFIARHIGTTPDDQTAMLEALGYSSRVALIAALVPKSIPPRTPPALPAATSEAAALARLRTMAAKNKVLKSFIGQG